jgi:hypothetical protein
MDTKSVQVSTMAARDQILVVGGKKISNGEGRGLRSLLGHHNDVMLL